MGSCANYLTVRQNQLKPKDIIARHTILYRSQAGRIVSHHSSYGAHRRAAGVWRKEQVELLKFQVQLIIDNAGLNDYLQILITDLDNPIHPPEVQHDSVVQRNHVSG